MTKISCFTALLAGKRQRSKITSKVSYAKKASSNEFQKVKPVEFVEETNNVDVGKGGGNVSACDTKVVAGGAVKLACEGRGQDDDDASLKMEVSDVDLVAGGEDSSGYNSDAVDKNDSSAAPDGSESVVGLMAQSSPSRLERSCSNIETAARCGSKAFDLPAKSLSYGDLMTLPARSSMTPTGAPDASPTASVKTSCSADHVMLKKRWSSQVLPSQSRKLWWKLFLGSHRDLHRPATTTIPELPSAEKQHDGYTTDAKNEGIAAEQEPIPNQWVAFSAETTSLERVNAWVNSLRDGSFHADDAAILEHDEENIHSHCQDAAEPSSFAGKGSAQARRRMAGEAIKASSIIQTLNTSSSVAHISGMGLTDVPMISPFSSLRAVNLSGNFIGKLLNSSHFPSRPRSENYPLVLQFTSPPDHCPRACARSICRGTRSQSSRGCVNWRGCACSISATTKFHGSVTGCLTARRSGSCTSTGTKSATSRGSTACRSWRSWT
ncbi:hypothetical protein GUJ93_ZPchr0006g42038 [Zizania palustris]|uniref:Uncharacterized protein n=1 Tax=Zizania palustris TaxID=103762 RepID=A0A8J5SPW1_ZIZPA|nr:hypothetical protein GUJ93_ZPchr0006g42038 [Zizania palustris]KAG8073800.1 hypothetical protein GUJ93_ZPchr0006g42038 [Zizania palustris]